MPEKFIPLVDDHLHGSGKFSCLYYLEKVNINIVRVRVHFIAKVCKSIILFVHVMYNVPHQCSNILTVGYFGKL